MAGSHQSFRWKAWFKRQSPYAIFGLNGINKHESYLARKWGRLFIYMMMLVAIWILLQWQLEALGRLTVHQRYFGNLGIWLFFLAEYFALLLLVKDRWRFFRENWMYLPIIIWGVLFLLHVEWINYFSRFKPFFALYIMIPSWPTIRSFFVDGRLRTTLLAAGVIVVVFGFLVAGIDPAVKTPWDGLWWALSTVSTVGYGDVVPVSALGRVIGAALIIMGLGIFVVITANFLALVIRKNVRAGQKNTEEDYELVAVIKELKKAQTETKQQLVELNRQVGIKKKKKE